MEFQAKADDKNVPLMPMRNLVIIGPFPPPVHGFAQATADVASLLERKGVGVIRLDLRPAHPELGYAAAIARRLSQLRTMMRGIRAGSPVYLALSGGMRQLVDLVFLTAARLGGAPIFVHHHSFAYLDKPNLSAKLCIAAAGLSAVHLTLCDGMKNALQKQYPSAQKVEVVSNSGLRSVDTAFRQRDSIRYIGYLSAVSVEKGALEFLEVSSLLAQRHPDLRFTIAGPCHDAAIRERVESACRDNPSLEYVGPVYGEKKLEFLNSLDLLLFPTSYRNEAEPLVIWEALSAGIPVIAWDRGCIGAMAVNRPVTGLAAIPRQSSFASNAAARIEEWLGSAEDFRRSSQEARERFERESVRSSKNIDRVFGLSFAGE